MPAEMAELGAKLLPADSPYRLVGDQLYEQYHEADYADMYPAEGQPALSPVDLALVTAFQSMEDLSDRQAAEAVRLRLDWKYALHQPVDYAGFNFSVLSEFRARVIQHGAEARVFEAVLGQLQALGLLKRRGRQRTDSAAVLTKVRQLNRLELVVETLRLAVRALLTADPTWTRVTVPPTWEERYGTRCVAERLNDQERAALQAAVGPDGQWLLDRLAEPTTPPALAALPEVQTLRTVWAQQYEVREREVVFRDPGPYDGSTRIQSPHDPEARYSEKRGQGWVGDKLQVTETDDEDLPHLITDIALTSSVESDQAALGAIQARQAARDVAPGQRVADQGYVSGQTLADSAQMGEDLIGPVPADHSPQARLPEGLTQDQFTVDLAQGTALCPAGQTAGGAPAARRELAVSLCGGHVCGLSAARAVLYGAWGPHPHPGAASRPAAGGPGAPTDAGVPGLLSAASGWDRGLPVGAAAGPRPAGQPLHWPGQKQLARLVCGGRGQPAAGGALVGGGAPPGAAAGVGPGGIGTKTARDTGVEPSQDACWLA